MAEALQVAGLAVLAAAAVGLIGGGLVLFGLKGINRSTLRPSWRAGLESMDAPPPAGNTHDPENRWCAKNTAQYTRNPYGSAERSACTCPQAISSSGPHPALEGRVRRELSAQRDRNRREGTQDGV